MIPGIGDTARQRVPGAHRRSRAAGPLTRPGRSSGFRIQTRGGRLAPCRAAAAARPAPARVRLERDRARGPIRSRRRRASRPAADRLALHDRAAARRFPLRPQARPNPVAHRTGTASAPAKPAPARLRPRTAPALAFLSADGDCGESCRAHWRPDQRGLRAVRCLGDDHRLHGIRRLKTGPPSDFPPPPKSPRRSGAPSPVPQ